MTLPEPVFLPGSAGRLFALFIPAAEGGNRGVVLLPPFAEEMNLSRRMLRLQAAALAEARIAGLLLDPFGTGDSAGDFADARWEIWVADVQVAIATLAAHGIRNIGLLGLRLGALLAAAAAPTLSAPCFATVLWQPVLHGRRHLLEFLRFRTLSGAWNPARAMTIETMRAEIAAGRSVEVAGYEVVPPVAAALEVLDLADLAHPALGGVTWFELQRDAALPFSAVGARCAAVWRAGGLAVTTRSIQGPAFWIGPGNALAPDLIAATTAAFAAAS